MKTAVLFLERSDIGMFKARIIVRANNSLDIHIHTYEYGGTCVNRFSLSDGHTPQGSFADVRTHPEVIDHRRVSATHKWSVCGWAQSQTIDRKATPQGSSGFWSIRPTQDKRRANDWLSLSAHLKVGGGGGEETIRKWAIRARMKKSGFYPTTWFLFKYVDLYVK